MLRLPFCERIAFRNSILAQCMQMIPSDSPAPECPQGKIEACDLAHATSPRDEHRLSWCIETLRTQPIGQIERLAPILIPVLHNLGAEEHLKCGSGEFPFRPRRALAALRRLHASTHTPEAPPLVAQLAKVFRQTLSRTYLYRTYRDRAEPNLHIAVKRRKYGRDFNLSLRRCAEFQGDLRTAPALHIFLREDPIGRPLIFVGEVRGISLKYYSAFEQVFDALEENRKKSLLGTVWRSLQDVGRYAGENPVYLLPSSSAIFPSSFFPSLFEYILENSNANVLGLFSSVRPRPENFYLNASVVEISRSRLDFLDESYVQALAKNCAQPIVLWQKNLARCVMALFEFRTRVAPLHQAASQALQAFQPHQDIRPAYQYLRESIRWALKRSVRDPLALDNLLDIYRRLSPKIATPLSERNLILTCATIITQNEYRDAPSSRCRRILGSTLDRIDKIATGEITEEPSWDSKAYSTIKALVRDFLTTGVLESSSLEQLHKLYEPCAQTDAPRVLREDCNSPPRFDSEGNLLLWVQKKGLTGTLHWDPQCANLLADGSPKPNFYRAWELHNGLYETRDVGARNGRRRSTVRQVKLRCCGTCKPPAYPLERQSIENTWKQDARFRERIFTP